MLNKNWFLICANRAFTGNKKYVIIVLKQIEREKGGEIS